MENKQLVSDVSLEFHSHREALSDLVGASNGSSQGPIPPTVLAELDVVVKQLSDRATELHGVVVAKTASVD